MKKVLGLVLSFLLVAMFAVPAFAASDVNVEEQKLLDKLTAGVVIGGKTVTLSAEEINLAKNFLMRDEIDLTADDVSGLLVAFDAIAKVMIDANVTDVKALSSADKLKIVQLAEDAVAAIESVELTFSYDFDTNTASIMDAQGAVLVQSELTSESTVIKDTANNLSMTWILLGALSLIVIGGVAVAGKKGLLTNA